MVGFIRRTVRVDRLLGERGIGHDSAAGCQESEWPTRWRSDPGKLAIAARLRSETILSIKWIAARAQIGTAKGAESVLPHLAQS